MAIQGEFDIANKVILELLVDSVADLILQKDHLLHP